MVSRQAALLQDPGRGVVLVDLAYERTLANALERRIEPCLGFGELLLGTDQPATHIFRHLRHLILSESRRG